VRDRRLDPEEGGRAMRIFSMYPDRLCGAWRTSPSLRTYSGWFSSQAEAWKGRVFRVSQSPVDTGCLCTLSEAQELLEKNPRRVFEDLRLPASGRRKEKAAAFIKTMGESPLSDELAALIDTAGVLELRKTGAQEAEAKVRAAIAEFTSFLYSVLKAYG
jgi:hypothetical protein